MIFLKSAIATVYEIESENKRLIGEPKIHTVVKGDYFQQLESSIMLAF